MSVVLEYRPVASGRPDSVAVLSINRPDVANAFNDVVIHDLVHHLKAVTAHPDVRALIVRGKGKHFSAGADLGWMKASATLSYDANVKDAGYLINLFEALAAVPVPTIAVVTGSAFGGAVGLTACCDIAVASADARFALSEVKLGLAPAVIMPYLARKIRPGALRRYALTGRLFNAEEAKDAGLIERIAPSAFDLRGVVRDEIQNVLAGAPQAQGAAKKLLDRVTAEGLRQGPHTAETIAGLRTSKAGQAGLAAFFDKKTAPWAVPLAADWLYAEDAP